MKNVHRLSLMVLTVLTAAFLVVDLPLMAQMGGQQRRGQQRAPQQKGAQQGAPRGAGQAQVGQPPEPKLSPQQEQRVKQLQQQAQSLFRNLQQVLGELQRLPKRGTQGQSLSGTETQGSQLVSGRPNPNGVDNQGRWFLDGDIDETQSATSNPSEGVIEDDPHTVIMPDGTKKEQKVELDGDRLAQTGRNDAAFIKFDGLKQQAQQIVNNLEGIGNEAKALGVSQTGTIPSSKNVLGTVRGPEELRKIAKDLEEFGVAVPAASVFFVDIDSQMDR